MKDKQIHLRVDGELKSKIQERATEWAIREHRQLRDGKGNVTEFLLFTACTLK